MEKIKEKGWFSKHVDAVVTIGVIFTMFIWLYNVFGGINERFIKIEQDLAVIKTVLVMQDIMPKKLAAKQKRISNDN